MAVTSGLRAERVLTRHRRGRHPEADHRDGGATEERTAREVGRPRYVHPEHPVEGRHPDQERERRPDPGRAQLIIEN